MNGLKSLLLCLFLLLICLPLSVANADMIAVGNPSFDEGAVSGTYSYDFGAWETNGGWLGNGYYSGAPAGDGWYFVLQSGTVVFQDLAATFESGGTYTFTIDVGTYEGGAADDWTIFIYDATSGSYNSPLATVSGVLPGGGVWYPKTVEYTATAVEAGHNIGIGFTGDYYALFDHAAVTYTPGVTVPSATDPSPAYSALDVPVDISTLSWQGTAEIADPKYDVWFGTDQGDLAQVATAQSQTNVPVTLDFGLQYYWRVDVVDDSTNPATVFPGSLWTFTTEAAQVTTLQAGPYVHFYNQGQVTIYYKTSAPVASVVEYGDAPSMTQTVSDLTAKTDHELTITGIAPETTYSYRIVINGLPASTHEFYSAFDAGPGPVPAVADPFPADELTDVYAQAAEYIINASGVDKGICIDYGCGTGRLAYEIAKRSNLKIIGFDDDPQKIAQAREYLDNAGVYGSRVSIIEITMPALKCRNYSANLVISGEMIAQGTCPGDSAEIFRVLKPGSGMAILGRPDTTSVLSKTNLQTWLSSQTYTLDETQGLWATIAREPLDGAGKWTHYYGDTANSANSGETRITNSLKALWYGNPGPRYIIDRHNRPMSSLYNKGLIITPGVDRIMAYDAYNGTRYWDMSIPDSARVAMLRDTGWVALADDNAYVVNNSNCVALDLKTGQPKKYFDAPQLTAGQKRDWGYIAVDGDNLIGSGQKEGASLLGHSRSHVNQAYYDNIAISTSEYLFCMDRQTGDLNWIYKNAAGSAIVNPGIIVAGDYVYFIESRNSSAFNDTDGRVTGLTLMSGSSEYIVKLNKNTGVVALEKPVTLPYQHVTYLSYAPDKDLVIASGTWSSGGYRYEHHAYNASNLSLAWNASYYKGGSGSSHGEQDQHPVIVGDRIYSKFYKVDLNNGSTSSLGLATGGCGAVSGCQTHLFARNSNPCMYELPSVGANKLTSETRIGCWINMIAAGGLVIAPQSDAGCTCDFQIQTSMTFVPQ